jgi:NAD(P)-dependent dehydrogenase (short-subunit alcohol dehydrogenase family)
MNRFEGRVAVVTGATSGIAREVARRFLDEGARVVAVGRDRRALAEIAATGDSRVVPCEADVTSLDAPSGIAERALAACDRIDVLVDAAGVIASGTLETTSDDGWNAMMEVNVTAPFRLMRAALPALEASRGSVVNVSSVTGLRSFPGVLAYCVSKAAVDQLTRCAALELASRGIRVNAVNPGVVVTNLHRRSGMSEAQYAAFLERSRETHPLGRPGQPADVAGLVCFSPRTRQAGSRARRSRLTEAVT